jgi:hypothetical protein
MIVRGRDFLFHSIVAVFVLHTSLLFGQEVSVTAAVDSTHIAMGDWLNLTVHVKHARAIDVQWGQWRDTLGAFDIIRQDSLQRDESGDVVTESKKFTLSKYDSGSYVIPSIIISYRSPGDTSLRYVQSDPLAIQVSSVQVDTAKGIKDIKPPLDVPLTWKEITLYTAIVAVIAALLFALYYYRKKWKKTEEVADYIVPKVPPHIQAIVRLKELQEKRMWQQGNVKGFYTEATEIVREYFEGRYGIAALELTSDEVFAQIRRFSLDAEVMKAIESFFIDADLVKFAKYMPVPSENEDVIPEGLEIVERTKLVAEVLHDV